MRRRELLFNSKGNYESVDLGLSVDWAVGNITKDVDGNYYMAEPTEYGAYFSWGNIDGHNVSGQGESYSFGTTNYGKTAGKNLTATFTSGDERYDAATATLGGNWRMPTYDEYRELISDCTWNWKSKNNTSYNGVAGYEVVGANESKIFFPVAGYYSRSTLYRGGELGFSWSTRYYSSSNAYCFYFYSASKSMSISDGFRENGMTIRPVKSK